MNVPEPSNYWDRIMNGVDPGEEEFTNILDILDFPVESLEGDDCLGGDLDPSKYQDLGPIPMDALSGISVVSQGSIGNGNANRVPCYKAPINIESGKEELTEDIEDNTSMSTPSQNLISSESSVFQMPSPVSVLESSCSSRKSLSVNHPVRARSKHARKSTVIPWLLASQTTYASGSKNRPSTGKDKEKMKSKPFQLPNALETTENFSRQAKKKQQAPLDGIEKKETSLRQSVAAKKCLHCEVTKTPQWREGPLGPKTLCNACGVRYRSGRLFPEYRPAASPTFVPSLHSNSHKKVIAMRKKAMQQAAAAEDDPPMSSLPEFIPMSSHLLEYLC